MEMNKKRVERLLPAAAKTLADIGIAKNGKIDKALRGQISSFGAAVATGSLLAAVAFFSDNGESKSDRSSLMFAIHKILSEENLIGKSKDLFSAVADARKIGSPSDNEMKELILDCAVAIKLAMNLYDLQPEKPKKKEESN